CCALASRLPLCHLLSVRTPPHPSPPLFPYTTLFRSLGDDAEVAAAATEPPEELGVLVFGRGDDLALGGDDVGADQVVGGEAELALEPAAAGAEREADDAGARHAPAGDGEPERQRLSVERAPVETGLSAYGVRVRVDADTRHRAHVEDDPVVDGREAGDGVASGPDRKRKPGRARETDRADDVGGPGRPEDHPRPAVEHAVEDGAPLVVGRIARLDDLAAKLPPQLHERV